MTEPRLSNQKVDPVQEDYLQKKAHYQADTVAVHYDATRWSSPSRRWSNQRKLRTIAKAIDHAARLHEPIRTALDLPCGTGRIFPVLFARNIRVTGADLSAEMMHVARNKFHDAPGQKGFVRCDAESIPFSTDRFDAVFSIRFLFHLQPAVRRRALSEMARVSRRWVIIDCRHRYTMKYRLRELQRRLGLSSKIYQPLSREELKEDFRQAGLEPVMIFPTFPIFSDKWVILGRKIR
ncbi:MAG: class I SAM-dependent methyltransferase [Nitrospirae bacterium]|nr:class I SAM-dependent methyltransferase [Nitrospirota bacterium]